jgi:hypothetical protein
VYFKILAATASMEVSYRFPDIDRSCSVCFPAMLLHQKTSPFEACFGYFPKYPLDFIFGKDISIDCHHDIDRENKFIEQIYLVHQMVREKLEKSLAKYKKRNEKNHVDHSFQVGDEVWIYISKEMQQNFVITFEFEHESPKIDTTLKFIMDRIFEEIQFEIVTTYQNQNRQIVRHLLHCYHVVEDDPLEENPLNIKFPEVEGQREVEGPKIE